MTSTVLVLGVGNLLLGDEGLGPRAIAELERVYRFPPAVRVLDGGTAGLSLLSEVTAVEKLVVLDAVQAGVNPGSVVAMEGKALRAAYRIAMGPHDVGLGELLAAARFHGGPKEIVLFGIEPETTELGWGLSPSVVKALPKLLAEVMRQLDAWGVGGRPRGHTGPEVLAEALRPERFSRRA